MIRNICTDNTLRILNWLLAASLVFFAGVIYRVHASRQELINDNYSKLPVSLRFFPFVFKDWVGRDVPIAEHIQRASGSDDFINRLYVKGSTNQWANVYIVYSGQPRTMLGHRPEVCYVGGGWIHEDSERSHFLSSTGNMVPCLIHRFYKPNITRDEVVVLNFYILNGQITNDEKNFSGLGWRVPNIDGAGARYVAQVQISSVLENPIRLLAKDIAELVLDYFPDEYGEVSIVGDGEYGQAVVESRK